MPSQIRIFVSSPGDVREERLRAQLVIAKLARDYAGLVELKPYFWESEPLRASGHFQDDIEPPSHHDIVVLILWSRLGTPLPVRTAVREYRGIDGRSPVTGTEWEFEDALAAFKVRQSPDLLVYRREGDPGASLADDALHAEQKRQWDALQAFWARHFENKGEFIAASARYNGLDAFDARLETDLAKLIERRLHGSTVEAAPLHRKGPPYRGLSAYDFSDAPVFFGRDGAVRSGLLRLSEAAARTPSCCAFLMVLGASGSGKSSLARAGLLPALVAAKAVPGVGLWRRVVLRPGDAGADPVAALAAALLAGKGAQGEGLAELAGPGTGASDLARHLRASVEDASYPFRTALGALAERERGARALLPHEEARLVLLVDQLEELFTRPDIAEGDRLAFLRLLAGLARSGLVWVIATMRSDLWHRAAAIAELLALTEEGARLDLLPPDGAELLEMIRRPARATGLSFEENDVRLGLDAVLAEAAAAEPGALPLLSVVLEDLYRRDVTEGGSRQLTFATYRAMGELTGAIATRAETAWWALEARDAQAAAALPEVLRAMVTASTGEAVTARAALLDAFVAGGAAARLIAAFTAPEVRLLVTEGQTGSSAGDGAVLRLAHEALLAHWPRTQEQIARDRRDLETRGRLESLYGGYAALPAGKARALLTGLPLEEGIDLVRRWGISAAEPLGAFVAASARRARVRRSFGYAVAACLVLLFAGIATYALRQAVIADERAEEVKLQSKEAILQAKKAKEQADRANAAEQRSRFEKEQSQKSELDAIVNECTTSNILRKGEPNNPKFLADYMSCSSRLGFSLLRRRKISESANIFHSELKIGQQFLENSNDINIKFFVEIANQGFHIASCTGMDINSGVNYTCISKILDASHAIQQLQGALLGQHASENSNKSRYVEEVTRGMLYISNLSIDAGRFGEAEIYSKNLLDVILNIPKDDIDINRALARAYNQLIWTNILSKKFDNALVIAKNAEQILSPSCQDCMSIIRLNLAHSLILTGNYQMALAEYNLSDRADIEKDVHFLIAHGICTQQLASRIQEKDCPHATSN